MTQADERLKPYWCFVCVRLKKPIVYIDIDSRESVQAAGYWMRLGVTAPSRPSLRQLIRKRIRDGFVQWQQSTFEPIRSQELDPVVATQETADVNREGVWYTGGRAYFVD
jgi:hypothetical protein